MIKLENVTKIFRTKKGDVHAVKSANLTVKKGEIHGVIGYSGAGKSTLIRCVNLLEKPTSGNVFVGDQELTALSKPKLQEARKKIGMIFQGFNLLKTATVADNIAIPLKLMGVPKNEIKKRVNKYIDIVGLTNRQHAYPAQLSGGQKQRVAIARALSQEPEVLLSDEATSALDPETTESILDLLLKINEEFGITILLITHEMDVIQRVCDTVSVMDDGEIVEQNEVGCIWTHPKHPTTRKFLNTKNDLKTAQFFKQSRQEKGPIYRLTFAGETTSEPLIAELSKRFNVHPNIIHAHMMELKNGVVGRLMIHFKGGSSDKKAALEYIQYHGVHVEVLEGETWVELKHS